MIKYIIICSIVLISISCNNTSDEAKAGSSIVNNIADTVKKEEVTVSKSDVNQDTSLAIKILGIWSLLNQENATFDIQKNKIYYPEYSKSYKYQLSNSTLKIKYDDYVDSFLVQMIGVDTLILRVEDEKQVYYRFKK